MGLFSLEIVGNNGVFYTGKVKILNVRGLTGDLGILASHSPLLTVIKIGFFSFIDENDIRHNCFSSGGILYVKANKNFFLADDVLYKKNLNKNRVSEIQTTLAKRISDESSKEMLNKLNHDLKYTQSLTENIKKGKHA